MQCWAQRGCDEEMQSRCPHNIGEEACPADCWNAACYRPTHVVSDNIDLLLNPTLNFEAAIKETCRFCEHFLVNGPQRSDTI